MLDNRNFPLLSKHILLRKQRTPNTLRSSLLGSLGGVLGATDQDIEGGFVALLRGQEALMGFPPCGPRSRAL